MKICISVKYVVICSALLLRSLLLLILKCYTNRNIQCQRPVTVVLRQLLGSLQSEIMTNPELTEALTSLLNQTPEKEPSTLNTTPYALVYHDTHSFPVAALIYDTWLIYMQNSHHIPPCYLPACLTPTFLPLLPSFNPHHLTPVLLFSISNTHSPSFCPSFFCLLIHFHPSALIIYLHLKWQEVQPHPTTPPPKKEKNVIDSVCIPFFFQSVPQHFSPVFPSVLSLSLFPPFLLLLLLHCVPCAAAVHPRGKAQQINQLANTESRN